MILCSACLLGVKCRYDGRSKPHKKVLELFKKDALVPVCPEQLSGLSTPREQSEIKDNRVVSLSGKDLTQHFKNGAEEVLRIARLLGIRKAILKERSAACGPRQIYDGTFSNRVIKGEGITAALLRKNNIDVISEEML